MKQRHLALVGILLGVSLVLTGCSFAAIMPESWLPMMAAFLVVFLSACGNNNGTVSSGPSGCDTGEPITELVVTDLDGCNGFRVGEDGFFSEGASYGAAVASAGDVDGDGFDDLLIGAPGQEVYGEGYYTEGITSVLFGDNVVGTTGATRGYRSLKVTGFYNEYSGYSSDNYYFDLSFGAALAGGDINGDGFSDAAFGAPDASFVYDGEGYDRYDSLGRATTMSGTPFWQYAKEYTGGYFGYFNSIPVMEFIYSEGPFPGGTQVNWAEGYGTYDGSQLGKSVAVAQDINGDGFNDLVVGAPYVSDGEGLAFTVLGRPEFDYGTSVESSVASEGAISFDTEGGEQYMGMSVSGAGDFNGDGFGDVLVGASNLYYNGGAMICFGHVTDGTRYPGNTGCLSVYGPSEGSYTGTSVSGGGDFNGDGYSDAIIGAPGIDSAFVVFGNSAATTQMWINGEGWNTNTGFAITGASGTSFGRSVASVGDFNGDGFDDIAIGAPYTSPDSGEGAGSAYIIFGKATWAATFDATAALDGTTGFVVNGGTVDDHLGVAVAAAGDANGDGLADVVIGAPGHYYDSGASYVVFGADRNGVAQNVGSGGNNQIDAGSADNTSAFGGAGNDVITVGTTIIRHIDGGNGVDALKFNLTGNNVLDFTEGSLNAGVRVRNIEGLDVRGDGETTVWLHANDVSLMSTNSLFGYSYYAEYFGQGSNLVVLGDSDDTLNTGNSFCSIGDGSIEFQNQEIHVKGFRGMSAPSVVIFTSDDMVTPDDGNSCE